MKQGFLMSKALIKDRVMSSIEISEVVDKKHKHVCRDIKVKLYEGLYSLNIDSPNLGYQEIQGLTKYKFRIYVG